MQPISDEDYKVLEDDLLTDDTVSNRVKTNFRKNWAPITDEWCVGKMINGNFNNRTNNRLESFHKKVKEEIETELTLIE